MKWFVFDENSISCCLNESQCYLVNKHNCRSENAYVAVFHHCKNCFAQYSQEQHDALLTLYSLELSHVMRVKLNVYRFYR